QLAGFDIDDLCRPLLATPLTEATPQRLVQTEGGDVSEPGWVVDERLTVGGDGVHHRMPAAAKVLGDVAHRPAMTTDLHRRPPAGPIRQLQPRSGDRRCLFGERPATEL